MQKTTFIYALCEPGTRTVRYLGKTVNPKQRLRQHLKESSPTKTPLGRWLRLLISRGEAPEMIVLREVPGNGSGAEMRYIRLARGCQMNLVNSTDGGEGITMTPEIRKKIGDGNRGRPSFMKGKSLTPEHCAKISASNTGRETSLEARKNMSLAKIGVPRSPEACAAVSAGMVGRPVSEKTRALISARLSGKNNRQFGVPRTPQEKAAISAGQTGDKNHMKGKKHTDEAKAKQAAGTKAAHARRKQRDQEIEWALAPYTLE